MTTAAAKKPSTGRAGPRPAWWPKRMSEAEFRELDDEHGGLCLACGELAFGDCEPDARDYPCEECDRRRVFGAEEARMMGAIVVEGDESWTRIMGAMPLEGDES